MDGPKKAGRSDAPLPTDPSSAYIPSSDPLYSSFLATMLTAQASGTTITVSTCGCVGITGSQQPKICVIDNGTRLPGT